MKAWMLCVSFLLAGCAVWGGPPLQAGVDGGDQLRARWGEPSMRWREADGSEQWAYARVPVGTQTFMVYLDPAGRLQRIEKALESSHFARIRPGVDDVQSIMRLIGPPNPVWSMVFEARNELAWEWQICDDWSKLARFGVLFDATSGIVRTSYQQPERLGPHGTAPWCGH